MKKLFDINVHGAYFTAREAARIMIPAGSGSIILIASMSAQVGLVPLLRAFIQNFLLIYRIYARSSIIHRYEDLLRRDVGNRT